MAQVLLKIWLMNRTNKPLFIVLVVVLIAFVVALLFEAAVAPVWKAAGVALLAR